MCPRFSKTYKPENRVKNMEVGLTCQKGAGWADPGGNLIPTRTYLGSVNLNIDDSDIIDIVKNYSTFLRHSETEIRFSEFLTTELNNKFFKLFGIKAGGSLQGMYIKDKDYLKKLIQANIPEDLNGKYRKINDGEAVSYIPRNEFSLSRANHINGLIKETNDLEQKLAFEEQIDEANEPTPLDPQEYDAISEDLKSYSVEEVMTRWGEDYVKEVLDDLNDEEL